MAYLQFNIKADTISQCIDFDVFLPTLTGLPELEKPYRTLYLLTGYSGGSKETFTFLNVQLQALLHNIAVVVVAGNKSFYVDKPEWGENYGRFVGEELPEVTRKLLPLSNKCEDTYIGGISMGGFGALLNGMRYRETFGKIFAISPAISPKELAEKDGSPLYKEKIEQLFENSKSRNEEKDLKYVFFKNKGKGLPPICLRCGREDELVWEQNKEFLKMAEQYDLELDYRETHGMHDLTYWKEILPECFSFLNHDSKRG